jgi:DNA-binding response OmpR family regulator
VSRVLVIDDDSGTLLGYKGILRAAGHEVATAALGEDGVAAAQRDRFDVVLCDLRLPDLSGLDVIHQIHESCPHTSIVLVTAWGTHESILEAKRLGATSYAAKPLIGDDLVAVVQSAQRRQAGGSDLIPSTRIGYAARRWAGLVIRAAYVSGDLRTILTWCRSVGLARSTLKNWCRAAGVTPKDSLDLVRLLHVVMHHSGEPWDLRGWLDIVDERTVQSLMRRAGFRQTQYAVPDLESFLAEQRLIISPGLVDALRERLSRV